MISTQNQVERMQELAGIVKENGMDLKSMLEDYIDYKYTVDQGYGEGVEHAEAKVQELADEIVAQKGKEWFDTFDKLAGLDVYYKEYAGPQETEEIEREMKELASELGSPVDKLLYF